jgi:hypothetical protein
MPGFSPRFFLVVEPDVTEGYLTLSEFPWVCTTGICATPVVTEGHVIPLGSILGVFSTTSASYNPRKPLFLYLVTGTSLGYLPLLFSYSVYKGCLRSHCGISKSQMVNLIPTCIVSNQKNHPAVLFCLFLCTEASPRLFFINTTVTFIWLFCSNV